MRLAAATILVSLSCLTAGAQPASNALPHDTADLPTRPVKLVDARTGRPVARATVRLDYLVGPLVRRAASLTSSPLGWVFVPSEVVGLSNERAWVTVPGYRRTRVDFTAANQRTRLRPE